MQKGSNTINKKLLSNINASGELHMVPASLNDKFVIRFCVCAENARDEDILYAYEVISRSSKELFEIIKLEAEAKEKIKNASLDRTESQLTIVEAEPEEEKIICKPDEEGKEKEIAELIKEENDIVQDVVVLDRKNHQMSLRYRRSFFVRMVSDPKFQQYRTNSKEYGSKEHGIAMNSGSKDNKINRAFSTSSNPINTHQQSRQTSNDSDN